MSATSKHLTAPHRHEEQDDGEALWGTEASLAHLHGGPLDGVQRELPDGPGDIVEFTHEARDGTWYVEYRKVRPAGDGWHYEATGGMDKQDEE